jgi:hypothetical protein
MFVSAMFSASWRPGDVPAERLAAGSCRKSSWPIDGAPLFDEWGVAD